jgi:hypothetical protein
MENLPLIPPQTDIEAIRVETALSRFPIHGLTGSEVRINIQNLGYATNWRVLHTTEYGQPGQLAYKIDTLIVNRRIEQEGRPIPKLVRLGSLREIAQELSNNQNAGTAVSQIKKALKQNAYATIEAKISYKTRDGIMREVEFGGSRYNIYFTGETLPDGRKADTVYISLNDIYRDILNSAQTRPLDYAYMKTLPPMAQRFYEIISYLIFACLYYKNITCKMRYSEFCKLSTATRYFDFNQVKKQMYKIHKQHIQSGYLDRGVTYQQTSDEEGKPDWWMFYSPGINAGRQYTEFTQQPHQKQKTGEFDSRQILLPFLEEAPSIPEKIITPLPDPIPTSSPNPIETSSTLSKTAQDVQEATPDSERVPTPMSPTLVLRDRLVEAGMGRGEALTQATLNP